MRNWITQQESRWGKYLPENITRLLIFSQIGALLLIAVNPSLGAIFTLSGASVYEGQLWRLITFIFTPLTDNLFFAAFVLYIYYLYGSVLERKWGSFTYFIFLFISYTGAVVTALLFPTMVITNAYLFATVFFAFAILFPNYPLLLFFVIPLKIRWIAYAIGFMTFLSFLFGPLGTKVLILLSFINLPLYFSEELRLFVIGKFRTAQKSPSSSPKKSHHRNPYHVCYVCKTNELDNPQMQIRYCDICKPTTCYCADHITGHAHRTQ